MVTAIIVWLVLQVPLCIVAGKFLKLSSDPLENMGSLVETPIAAAPSAAEPLTRGECADVMP